MKNNNENECNGTTKYTVHSMVIIELQSQIDN